MHNSKNVEIHVVDHCNLDCIGCSHESPLMARRFEDPDRLATALRELWRFYRAPLVKLLGGEPLLHPGIDEIIAVAKETTGATVRLVTNGTLLARRKDRLRGVDEIHISTYPAVEIPTDPELAAIAADLAASVTLQRFDRFRWHKSPARTDDELTQRIFDTCQLYHSWQCHTVREGWFYPCPPAATWGSDAREGLNLLDSAVDKATRLHELLGRERPLKTCIQCLGSTGQLFQHQQGWRRPANATLTMGVDQAFLKLLTASPQTHNECYEYRRTFHPSGRIEIHGEV